MSEGEREGVSEGEREGVREGEREGEQTHCHESVPNNGSLLLWVSD